MLNDVIANMLSSMKNAERAGKDELMFNPVSTLGTSILKIMKDNDYIKDFEAIEDGKGGVYRIILLKKINDCNVIKPRFPVTKDDFQKWERRFLPAEGFGTIIISTPKGIMTHVEAKKKKTGGRLIAYVY
jgi:small subunit ribosomal protein S8